MIPILDHETRRLCIKVKGACGKIEVTASGLSFVLTRVGGIKQIIASADPMQLDGRICMTLDKAAYDTAKAGRYVARLVGASNCNLCIPIQIGARCQLEYVSTEMANEYDDCVQTTKPATEVKRPLVTRSLLRR